MPDAPLGPALAHLGRLAAALTDAPIAAVGLREAESGQLWFPWHAGLAPAHLPSLAPLLTAAMADPDVFVVADAADHASPADDTLAGIGVRFVAGLRLGPAGNGTSGAILMMDTAPRELGEREREGLRLLARHATDLLQQQAQGRVADVERADLTQQLLRAKVALETIFDAMPDLVGILDQDGRIRRLNQSLALRVGRPLRGLIGEELSGLLPFCAAWLAEAGAGPAAAELQEPQTGAVYEASLLPIQGPTLSPGERVVILRDVTAQREMARRVAAFERRAATGDLLLRVAHEVRNPLAAVQAAAESLGLDADRERAMLVDIIREQVQRLGTLMSDLLDVARPAGGAERRRESLAAFCREAVATWRRNPARAPRAVKLHLPPDDELPVLIQRQRIEQVLVNVLDNAADHSLDGSPIEVEVARRHPGLARIRAVDRGSGLPEGEVARMFEPFFTTREKGTGLGLTIAKGIVEDHGGRIVAWRNDPPPGLTVEFTLPLAPEP